MGGRRGSGSAGRRGFAGAVLVQGLACELLLTLQRGGSADDDLIVHAALASTSLLTLLLAVALPAAKRWLADLAPPLLLLPFAPALADGESLPTLLAACWAPALLMATLRPNADTAPTPLPRRLAAALVRTSAASILLFIGVLAAHRALPAPAQMVAALVALPLTLALAAHLGRRIGASLTIELSALADPSPALVLAGDEELAALAVDLDALRARVAAEEAALAARTAALAAQETARSAFLADLEALAATAENSAPTIDPPALLLTPPTSATPHANDSTPLTATTPLAHEPAPRRAPTDDAHAPRPTPRNAPHARPPSRPHEAARPLARPTEAPLPRRFTPRSAPLAAAHGGP